MSLRALKFLLLFLFLKRTKASLALEIEVTSNFRKYIIHRPLQEWDRRDRSEVWKSSQKQPWDQEKLLECHSACGGFVFSTSILPSFSVPSCTAGCGKLVFRVWIGFYPFDTLVDYLEGGSEAEATTSMVVGQVSSCSSFPVPDTNPVSVSCQLWQQHTSLPDPWIRARASRSWNHQSLYSLQPFWLRSR